MAALMRRKQRLGAITGEKLQFYIPASVFTVVTKPNIDGVCFESADRLTARLEERARAKPKSADKLNDLLTAVLKEARVLRAKGVTGPIPVCLHRGTGVVANSPRYVRRGIASHESFHADVRRVEWKGGAALNECVGAVESVLRPALTPRLLSFFRRNLSVEPEHAVEEVLASLEELRINCTQKSKRECAEYRSLYAQALGNKSKGGSEKTVTDFFKLSDSVKQRFSTPLNAVRAAVRACKVPR